MITPLAVWSKAGRIKSGVANFVAWVTLYMLMPLQSLLRYTGNCSNRAHAQPLISEGVVTLMPAMGRHCVLGSSGNSSTVKRWTKGRKFARYFPFLLNCCHRVAVHFLRDMIQESLAQAEDMAHELLGSEQGQTVILVGPDADIPADWGFDAQRIGVLHLDGDPQLVPVIRGSGV